MSEWMDRAVPNQANLDKGYQAIPPNQGGPTQVAPIEQMPTDNRPLLPMIAEGRALNLTTLADALRAVASYPEAAALPAPKSLAREATALVRQQVREARGLPGKPEANKKAG